MMVTGMSRALPLGASSTSPRARGPLGFSLRASWAGAIGARLNPRRPQMTAPKALRYKDERIGEAAMLDINDKAPDLTLEDQNGKEVSLRDFRGKTVVLFFFPKANTPG